MLLNVSFEKTISIEIEIPDDVDITNVDHVVDAIQQTEEMDLIDSWLDDQPAVGYQIDDAEGRTLFGKDDRLAFFANPNY